MLQRFTKETFGSFPFSSLRIDREQHVPDSSNHSLYLMKLFNSSSPGDTVEGISHGMVIRLLSLSNLEGNFGPDGSISFRGPLPPPSPPPQPRAQQQHATHNTEDRDRDRDRDTETETQKEDKTQVLRTICTSDTFHDVRLEKPLTSHNGFIYIYVYICHHESRTPQHSKWNCVGANRPQQRHMYSPHCV